MRDRVENTGSKDREMNEPEPRKGGFWTSLPGVLTGVAGLVAAIAGLLALFVAPGGDSGSTRAEWADKVEPICSEATDDIRALPLSLSAVTAADGATIADYLRQVAAIARDMAADVRAIEAPVEDQGSVDRMTALWDRQADGIDALTPDLLAGNLAVLQRGPSAREIQSAETEAEALASSLGVTACAQAVQPTFSR